MAKTPSSPTSNLDDFVSAADAVVGAAHSAVRVTSAVATRPSVEGDLESLIGAAGGASQYKTEKAPTPKVGAGKTAARTDLRTGSGLDGLVQQAAHSLSDGDSKAVNADASVSAGKARQDAPIDISQLIANAAGRPSAAPVSPSPVGVSRPAPADRAEPATIVAAPASEDRSVSPVKRAASRSVGPWAAAMVISLLLAGGGWFGYQHWKAKPSATQIHNNGPQFPLTSKQKELVEPLRAAHAEVEHFRSTSGRLPTKIELKVSGVVFYMRPVKDSYMIFAVSGHENLVLTGDGHWHKAR